MQSMKGSAVNHDPDREFPSARLTDRLSDLCSAWLAVGPQLFFGTARTVLSTSEQLLDKTCAFPDDRRRDGRTDNAP